MEKLKNRNTIVLIVSLLLIVVSVIIAVSAISGSKKDKKAENARTSGSTQEISLDLSAIAAKGSTNSATTAKPSAVSPASTTAVSNHAPGKYRVNTQGDSLSLRLEPNTTSDRLLSLSDGTEVNVLVVSGDWGYVVHEKTGGWLSMTYLAAVDAGTVQ